MEKRLIAIEKTDIDGKCQTIYNAKGKGDVKIVAYADDTISNQITIEDYQAIIQLDGSESKRQITGSTTISNGEMSCGSSYLTESKYSVNLQENWEITCDIKWAGPYSASLVLVKQGTTTRDTNRFMIQDKEYSCNGNGKKKWISHPSTLSKNQYYSVKLTCINGVLTSIINNWTTTITSTDWELLGTDCEMGIGVDTWGHCAFIKNIKITQL